MATHTTPHPPGEKLRSAIRWFAEQRKENPDKKLAQLIDEASMRFDLSPLEAQTLAGLARDA